MGTATAPLILLLAAAAAAAAPPADLVLRGGRIYTVDAGRPWAEALAIRGDTIVAVGSDSDTQALIGPDTEVLELGGRLALPGFVDAHIHFLEGALYLDQIQLDDARSLSAMQARVHDYARAHPDAPWILGRGWIYTYIDGGRLPTRHDLDRIVSDRPVLLEAYDGHTAWVNSKALEVAGVSEKSEPLGPGEVVREADGRPSGVLKEGGAIRLVSRAIPEPTREDKIEALRRGMAEARRCGITSIQNASGSPEELELYEALEHAGELTLRNYSAMSIQKDTSSAELDRIAQLQQRLTGPWVKAGAVKLMMDGVIESHTAAMLEPYSDDPSLRGSPNFSQTEIDQRIAELDRRGFQILTHAIGDRAVRMVLDAYEKAARDNPPRPRRHRIEHIETIAALDQPRFAALGVVASMQPYHASPDIVGVWAKNAGPERERRAFGWRDLRDAGARVIHGSDWPVVTLSPLVGLHAAVTREDLSGQPPGGWIPRQRLSLEQAILGYTLDAAYGSFDEKLKGSLEPGKLADIVILQQNLFSLPASRIGEVEVWRTLVGGRVVYSAAQPTP